MKLERLYFAFIIWMFYWEATSLGRVERRIFFVVLSLLVETGVGNCSIRTKAMLHSDS